MRPITVTVGPLASAVANNIATSQTPTSGTALTLNGTLVVGGVAVLDAPRRVLLTTGSEAAQRTLVITGTNWSGSTISETLTVPITTAGTVASVLDYKTVTSLMPLGGGWTAAVTVGTNTVAGSAWIMLDSWALPQVSLQCNASGTVNYTVQQTLDNPNSITDPVVPVSITWINHPDTAMVAATTSIQSNYAYAPIFTRVVLNSGSGSVTYTASQANVVSA